MPHSAPHRIIPFHAPLVLHDGAFVPQLWKIPHEGIGAITLLHKTIHLSAATVDSVWHLCNKIFLIYGYHSAHYARTVRVNYVEIPWAMPKRRNLRSAAPVQTGTLCM
jgi:hypothetical protein